MKTLSTLAIRVITQHAEAIGGLAATAVAVGNFAAKVVESHGAVQAANASTAAAATAYRDVAGEVTRFTGKLLGVATVAAAASKAIGMSATESMVKSYGRLSNAVESAFKAFGEGFDKSAGLAKVLNTLAAAVENSIGFLYAYGERLATVVSWLTACAPVAIALTAAVKVMTVAIMFLVQVALTRWIIAKGTLLLLGESMTGMQLALAASTWALSAAYTAASVACGLLSAAMAVLAAVGLPVWAAITIVVGVVAVSLLAVAGLVWGLVRAWKAWTTPDVGAEKIAKLDEFQEKLVKSTKTINEMTDALRKQADQAGMSDRVKKIDDFKRALEAAELENPLTIGAADAAERLNTFIALLDKIEDAEAAEKRLKREVEAATSAWKARQQAFDDAHKMLVDLEKVMHQVGMTEEQKKLDEFVSKLDQYGLLAGRQRDALIAQFEVQQQQITAAENRLKIEKDLADLQKEAAQAGLSDAQKKVAALRDLGANEAQIAAAQAALNKMDAAEEKNRLAERAKQITESVETPAEKFKKQVGEINILLARGMIAPDIAMRAADAARLDAMRDLMKPAAGRIESPKALLMGTADASLAEDRARTEAQVQMDLEKRQLAALNKVAGEVAGLRADNAKKQAQVVAFPPA